MKRRIERTVPDPLTARLTRAALFSELPIEVAVRARYSFRKIEFEEANPVKRKMMLQPVILIILLLALCGAALATTMWDSGALLSWLNPNREKPSSLTDNAQSVGVTIAGKTVNVAVSDAIYDGGGIILPWTVENLTDDTLYILQGISVNGLGVSSGTMYNSDYTIIKPHEVVECGVSGLIAEYSDNDAVVSLILDVFRLNGDPVRVDYPDSAEYNHDNAATYAAYIKMIDDLFAEGIVAIEGDGSIAIGQTIVADDDGSLELKASSEYGELIAVTGKATLIEKLNADFDLKITNSASAVTLPIVKDNGYYELRVTQADMHLDSLIVTAEVVFQTYEEAMKYTPYNESKTDLNWQIKVSDADNADSFAYAASWGVVNNEPKERPDGTWVWEYQFGASNLVRQPRGITLTPYWGSIEKGESVARPEDAITIILDTVGQ
ncbi:hypothetical protein AGMMS49992_06940 [Clostridia bacterium]|nr:hypothetical protein AGMMS49992_06940 [Clostridia bacterium]